MTRRTQVLLPLAALVLVVLNVLIWRAVLAPARARPGAASPTPATVALPTRQALPSATRTAFVSSPTQPAPTPQAATATARPQATVTRTTVPASPTPALLTSADDITRAVQAGRHGAPFRIIFTEQEISREITTYLLSNSDLGLSDVGVSLQSGAALITGKANVAGLKVGFKATTTVRVDNGRPRLKVLQLDLLAGLVPGFIKDRLIQMIEQSADLPLLADLPVTIDRVDIEPGQAVVSGATS